jgi:arylsulfatase A-like enzyme
MLQDSQLNFWMKIGVVVSILLAVFLISRREVHQEVSATPRVGAKRVATPPAAPASQKSRSPKPRSFEDDKTEFPDSKVLQKALKPVTWGKESPPRAGGDVVLIVLDTVRRDRLGVYGYEHHTTPGLDRWASGSRVYDNARSVSSWTLPSHASLFTGQYPISHGVRTAEPGGDVYFYALPDGRPTLAAALQNAGYATAGITANRAFLNRKWGLHQGFDVWLCDELGTAEGIAYVTADRITDLAIELLESPREKPVFLFLNYMDAHGPLIPRVDYLPDGVKVSREQMPTSARGNRFARALMQRREPLPDSVREAWSQGYDAELRFLDEHVTRLLERLPALGVDDEDYVIILADHGEFLGEHDLVGHNKDIYEEGIAIPLLVRGPGFSPGLDQSPAQTVDVPRWILDGLGIERLPRMEETGDLQVAELYWNLPRNLSNKLMRQRFNRVRRAYIQGDNKLILGTDGSEERYQLSQDPNELRSLKEDSWKGSLQEQSTTWLGARTQTEGSGRSIDDDEALRALGYIE